MHQIRFWLGLLSRPGWGSLQLSPDPIAGFEGPTSKGEGRDEEGKREQGQRKRKGLERTGRGERGEDGKE